MRNKTSGSVRQPCFSFHPTSTTLFHSTPVATLFHLAPYRRDADLVSFHLRSPTLFHFSPYRRDADLVSFHPRSPTLFHSTPNRRPCLTSPHIAATPTLFRFTPYRRHVMCHVLSKKWPAPNPAPSPTRMYAGPLEVLLYYKFITQASSYPFPLL